MVIPSENPPAKRGEPLLPFECQRCGECCSTMGEIISVQEQIRPFEFRIRYTDGEERVVAVDPEKRALFEDHRKVIRNSPACPFLRQSGAHERICTVHGSRPELCRMYLCCRILILDSKGQKIGRVLPGTRFFTTEDNLLLELWNRSLRNVTVPDEDAWENSVESVLTGAGYRVIR